MSRYYDPVTKRFINADNIGGQVGELGSHNIFSYCQNNPVINYDPTGHDPIALILAAIGVVTAALAVTVSIVLISQLAYWNMKLAEAISASVQNYLTEGVQAINNPSSQQVRDHLGTIAGSHAIGRCVEASKEMQDYLKSKKKNYQVIRIQFPQKPGYVWSKSRSCVISTNGYHEGVEVDGIVYCNIHPFGLPKNIWLSDFEEGYGRPPLIY